MVVVGAGPTGVELAGQIRELATRCLEGRVPDASTRRRSGWCCVDGGKEPLATFGDQLSGKATRDLDAARASSCAWAPGSSASTRPGSTSPTADGSDVAHRGPHDDLGRRRAGLAARPPRWPRPPAPSSTGPAHLGAARPHAARPPRGLRRRRHGHPRQAARRRRGRHAGRPPRRQHDRRVASRGEPALPFRYRDLGSVATIGRFRAVASIRKVRLSGFPGWLVWFFVHLAFLTGFGDRFSTMAALAALDGRAGPGRAGVQHRPHRRRPEPPAGGRAPSSSRTPFPNAPTVEHLRRPRRLARFPWRCRRPSRRSPTTPSCPTATPARSSRPTARSTGCACPRFDAPSVFGSLLDREAGMLPLRARSASTSRRAASTSRAPTCSSRRGRRRRDGWWSATP